MIDNFVKLGEDESAKFNAFIKENRVKFIKTPKDTLSIVINKNKDYIKNYLDKRDISKTIIYLREESYNEFLMEEKELNNEILSSLAFKFDVPRQAIDKIAINLFNNFENFSDFRNELANKFGKYSGLISPYIYTLNLSNTQSRRSRAGKTFENVIYALYETFNYPYNSQASIGRKVFSNLGLSKVVDSILSSVDAFNEFRNRCIIGTMKTTLREMARSCWRNRSLKFTQYLSFNSWWKCI